MLPPTVLPRLSDLSHILSVQGHLALLPLPLHPIFLPKQFRSTWGDLCPPHPTTGPVSPTQQLPLPAVPSLSSLSLIPPLPRTPSLPPQLKVPQQQGEREAAGTWGHSISKARPRWWAQSETSLYCLYRTNMRKRERPVGKRENCQINDTHTQRKRPPTPQKSPTHPRCLSVNYLLQEVEDQTTEVTFPTPADVGGKGERPCGKGTSQVPLPLDQHPSPWDEMLG